ncbi:MAG: hypothetical protein Q8868_02160 [Bacteroidota bacterium]|nr:hypothetical protein [Bacteroidota bacterium]
MKIRILALLIISLFTFAAVSGQTSDKKANPVGKWKFEAPYAPEGYTSGTIDINLADNKYSTSISFAGSDYKIPGDKTKIENDTISFTVLVEGTEVAISLKAEDNSKMTGKAVYTEGEIPLTLTRDNPKN